MEDLEGKHSNGDDWQETVLVQFVQMDFGIAKLEFGEMLETCQMHKGVRADELKGSNEGISLIG